MCYDDHHPGWSSSNGALTNSVGQEKEEGDTATDGGVHVVARKTGGYICTCESPTTSIRTKAKEEEVFIEITPLSIESCSSIEEKARPFYMSVAT